TVALGCRHCGWAGRDRLLEGGAVSILGHVHALSLADLHQVAFDTGKGDLLFGPARGGQRPVLQVQVKEAKAESGRYGEYTENAHGRIVVPQQCQDKTKSWFRLSKVIALDRIKLSKSKIGAPADDKRPKAHESTDSRPIRSA